MANVCKGICVQYKALGYKGKHRYEDGQKRCPICEEFIKWDGVRCPCCCVILRITPKDSKARQRMIQKKMSQKKIAALS